MPTLIHLLEIKERRNYAIPDRRAGERWMEYEGWRDVHVGFEGDGFKIRGVKIWGAEWRRTDLAAVQLPHPAHQHQRHRFDVYEVGNEPKIVRFAAGELSNGVWGFYVPT